MSKQRFFRNVETELKMEIAKIVLKRQAYKCAVCGVKHKSHVVKYSSGYSDALDSHEMQFLKNSGVKPIRIILCTIPNPGFENSSDPANYQAYCGQHTQEKIKARIAEIKKKRLEGLGSFRTMHIVEVKNFIFSCTGKVIQTKDAIGLIMRMEQVLNKQ